MRACAWVLAFVAVASLSAQQPILNQGGVPIISGSGGGGGSFSSICAGSADTQVLFNDGGSCAGDAGFVFTKASDTITLGTQGTSTGVFQFKGTTSGTLSLSAADAAGTYTLKLPASIGTADFALITDGTNQTSFVSGQSIAGLKTTSTPQFLRMGIGGAADGTIAFVIPTTTGELVSLGSKTAASTATPVVLSLGASYANAANSPGLAKLKFYDDSVANNTYGMGISSGAYEFFAAAAASYFFEFAGVSKAKVDSSGNFISLTGGFLLGTATGAGAQYIEGWEQSADPGAPAANSGRIFFKDSGGGKTQACVRFATGATQCFATEP